MEMRHWVLMLLKASDGSISSKTKIQKEMYFLSLWMKEDFVFRPHYYGPYSPEVEQGLNELIGAGFVNMRRESFGVVSQGFEIQRYDFSMTDEGKEMADYLKKENPDKYSNIEGFIKKLKDMGNPNYLQLSIAAKVYFILHKEGRHMTKSEIIEKAKSFDWNIRENDIYVAVEILQKLNIITTGK
jgi:hypothetical protein